MRTSAANDMKHMQMVQAALKQQLCEEIEQGKVTRSLLQTAQSDLQKAQSDLNHAQLQNAHRAVEHEALQTAHADLQTAHADLKHEDDQLKTGFRKVAHDEHRRKVENEVLQMDNAKLKLDHDELQMENIKLKLDHDELQKKFGYAIMIMERSDPQAGHPQAEPNQSKSSFDDEQDVELQEATWKSLQDVEAELELVCQKTVKFHAGDKKPSVQEQVQMPSVQERPEPVSLGDLQEQDQLSLAIRLSMEED